MTERGSMSGKAGQAHLRPPRAAPSTPDALHPTPVRNNENRCINEVRPSGANHTYAYAENGLRWSSQMGGSVHVHNSIWVDDDVINDYVDGGLGGRYDVVDGEVLSYRAGGSRNLYVPDPLGSVNHVLDTSLNKAATYVYWPFGELQSNTGIPSGLQFVGALGYDTLTTNRVYVRAREYRPDLGRWQTEDPIGFVGGEWNLFPYCLDDPVGVVDASGLLPSRADLDRIKECAKRCRDKSGRDLWLCLGSCLGKDVVDRNCDFIACMYNPGYCPPSEPGGPCMHRRRNVVACHHCCDVEHFCFLITRLPPVWGGCTRDHDNCALRCDCEMVIPWAT